MRSATSIRKNSHIVAVAMLVIWAIGEMLLPVEHNASQLPQRPADKKAGLSAEAQQRVLQAVSAVGQILVRRSGDPVNQNLRARGSAVVVRKDGVVVTNYHVIAEDKSERLYDGIYFSLPADATASSQSSKLYPLKVALLNKSKDLALLRLVPIDTQHPPAQISLTPIEIGDSRRVKLLESLFVIGFPEKGGSTVTINSGMIEGTDLLEGWIKTDARLIHGNSGGAAVGSDGKLIGIPTKVVADRQPLDKDGDGFPDDYRWYGAVGFLRPAYLVEAMLAELCASEAKAAPDPAEKKTSPQPPEPAQLLTVIGIVRSAIDNSPIAGARVGLTPLGTPEVTASNLLTWGGTNGEGQFTLNRQVPAGRYTLKAKAINYEPLSLDVEIKQGAARLLIELRPSQ